MSVKSINFGYLSFAGMLSALITLPACNKFDMNHQEQRTKTIAQAVFNPSTGAPIDTKKGLKWIANYRLNSKGPIDYFILFRDIEHILSQTGAIGVCLFYAHNPYRETIILPIGINQDSELMKTSMVPVEEGVLDWETAVRWITEPNNSIKARFFGSKTFERMAADPNCRVIRVSFALDEEGNEQLLLSDAAQSVPYSFETTSRPCPPYCPTYK